MTASRWLLAAVVLLCLPARAAAITIPHRTAAIRGDAVRVELRSRAPLTRVRARLYRGSTLVGRGRLARLRGARSLRLRLTAPRPGRHVLRLTARDRRGRVRRATFRLRLRTRWWEGWTPDDPRLSQPVYEESVFEPLEITAPDGTHISAAVIRPKTPPGVRIPAIVQLSPYLGSPISRAQILQNSQIQKYGFVERGYALVGVSIRGTGASGGCLDYEGERGRGDMNAILDTIAGQPWSNGNLGAAGLSWDGTTLNAAALSGNPHLKAIVPAGSNTDWYQWSYMQGVPTWYVGYTFALYAPATVAGAGVFGAGAPAPQEAGQRACPALSDSVAAQESAATAGARNPWWDERDFVRFADRINPRLAVLQVSGYIDDGVRVDNLHDWDPTLRKRLPDYHALIGDWAHMWPDTPNVPLANNPDIQMNEHPLTSWSTLLLRWYDHWLLGKPTGIERMPGALLQDDDGDWHGEDALTPSRAVTERLHPTATNTLSTLGADGTVSFVDDGAGVDPRGTCLYAAIGLLIGCVPAQRPSAQYFVTEPYTRPVRYSGVIRAHLRLTHSAPRGQVGVTVYAVDGEHWNALSYGFASMLLRNDDHTSEAVDPGVAFDQDVEVLARDFTIKPGQRLAVAIGSQVGRYPMGLSGNGYLGPPSGAITDIDLAGTAVDLPRLPRPGPVIPLP